MFGVNPWKLMLWMGHKRIDETMLYVQFAEVHMRPVPESIIAAGRENDDPDRRISEPRFRMRPGRGHHADRSVGEIVAIDADLWSHFGSAEAVNDALRHVIAERKKASGF